MGKSGARKEMAPSRSPATSPPQHLYPGAPTSSASPALLPHMYAVAPMSSSANPSTPPHLYPHGWDSSCTNPLLTQWRPMYTPAPDGLLNYGQLSPMHSYNFRPPHMHHHEQEHQNMDNLHFVGASPHDSFSTPPPPPPRHKKVASQSAPRKVDSTSSKRKRKAVHVDDDQSGERTAYRLPYTPEEHVRLASAWLECSLDPIDGNGKKGEQFWDDIATLYNDGMQLDKSGLGGSMLEDPRFHGNCAFCREFQAALCGNFYHQPQAWPSCTRARGWIEFVCPLCEDLLQHQQCGRIRSLRSPKWRQERPHLEA